VVTPQQMQARVASHWAAFAGQLKENQQAFLNDVQQAIAASPVPDELSFALKQRLQQIQTEQSELFQSMSAKLSLSPLVSLGLGYLAGAIAERILARLPARFGFSALSKALKTNLLTVLLAIAADEALTSAVRSDLIDGLNNQMQQSEKMLRNAVLNEAKGWIQDSESDLGKKIQDAIHRR